MSFHGTSWQLWISRSIRLLARSRMDAWVLFNPRESKALPDRVQHHADGGRDECIAENRLYLRHRNAQAVAGRGCFAVELHHDGADQRGVEEEDHEILAEVEQKSRHVLGKCKRFAMAAQRTERVHPAQRHRERCDNED